jgi:hypothetical protein
MGTMATAAEIEKWDPVEITTYGCEDDPFVWMRERVKWIPEGPSGGRAMVLDRQVKTKKPLERIVLKGAFK